MFNECKLTYNIHLISDRFCKYRLKIFTKEIALTFPQLLQLRANLLTYTSSEKLDEIVNNENFVLLFIADKQHLIYLDIPQLLDLKEEVECFFCRF